MGKLVKVPKELRTDFVAFCSRPWWQFWNDPHTWGAWRTTDAGPDVRDCLYCYDWQSVGGYRA